MKLYHKIKNNLSKNYFKYKIIREKRSNNIIHNKMKDFIIK